jgi:polyvinyl alcohol dehydrogenase (cytochrome)
MRGLSISCAALVLLIPVFGQAPAGWPFAGQNLSNTRSTFGDTAINVSNAGQLTKKWEFTTRDDVSATPAVDTGAGALYIPDWAGYIYKIDTGTGHLIWSHPLTDYGLPSTALSRTTPALDGNVLVIGASSSLATGQKSGAYLLALDATTGNLIWKQMTDPSLHSLLTGSPIIYQGVVYAGISSGEELVPDPTFRGSVVAYGLTTGALIWRTYMTPYGYTGVPIWSSTPVVDPKRNSLYVTTGNNYTVPASVDLCEKANIFQPAAVVACQDPTDYVDSVVSLDLTTGVVNWSRRGSETDAFVFACLVLACPAPRGKDYDFGAGANLYTTIVNGRLTQLLGAGQKSGYYYALNPDTGVPVWVRMVGPGGLLGGIQWGTATDNLGIYVAIANFRHATYTLQPSGMSWNGASWADIAPNTGKIVWQVPDPGADPLNPGQPAMATGPVTVVNGVVYAPSMSGYIYALSGRTGATLWSYDTGGSVNAAPAVVNGVVYWGSGYGYLGGNKPVGTHNNKLFAFALPPQ